MKRVVACVALAIAVAGCGNDASSDELRPATTTKAPEPTVFCDMTQIASGLAVAQVSYTNNLSVRASAGVGVDLYFAGEWVDSDGTVIRSVPPGQSKTARVTFESQEFDRGEWINLSCEIYAVEELVP